MDIASELGCKGVIFHTNIIPGFETESYLEGYLRMNALFFEKLCKAYPDLNVYVENMFDYKPDMQSRLAKKLEKVTNFGLCYDVAHGEVHDVGMNDWFKSLKPYIRHLHINDNDGKADLHMSVGSGVIDWKKYFELIEELDESVGMLIEVNGGKKQEESFEYLAQNGFIKI